MGRTPLNMQRERGAVLCSRAPDGGIVKIQIWTVLITLTLDEAEVVSDAIDMAIDGGALDDVDRPDFEPEDEDDLTCWEVDALRVRAIVEAIDAAGEILIDSHAGEVAAGLATGECAAGLEMKRIALELAGLGQRAGLE